MPTRPLDVPRAVPRSPQVRRTGWTHIEGLRAAVQAPFRRSFQDLFDGGEQHVSIIEASNPGVRF